MKRLSATLVAGALALAACSSAAQGQPTPSAPPTTTTDRVTTTISTQVRWELTKEWAFDQAMYISEQLDIDFNEVLSNKYRDFSKLASKAEATCKALARGRSYSVARQDWKEHGNATEAIAFRTDEVAWNLAGKKVFESMVEDICPLYGTAETTPKTTTPPAMTIGQHSDPNKDVI